MVNTVEGIKNILWNVGHISITYIHGQAWGHFGLHDIRQVTLAVTDPFLSQVLPEIASYIVQQQNLYYRVC